MIATTCTRVSPSGGATPSECGIDVSADGRFEMKRRRIREALEADGVSGEIDALVTALLAQKRGSE